jgi:hypothetical protein
MVVQEAVAVKLEWFALFEIDQCRQKGLEIGRLVEYVLAVVAAIDNVINQAIVDRSQGAGHEAMVAAPASPNN